MAVTLSLFAGAGAQFFDNSGVPLSGGKIYTYSAGTTTPLVTYTTNAGNVAHTNPIVLDSAGRIPSGGEIWLTLGIGYKFVVKTSAEVLIATYDNIPSSAQPPAANDADSIMYEQGYTVTAGSFVIGSMYRIVTLGTTNFMLIGATSNTVGLHFTATGAGSGTGTAELSQTVETRLRRTINIKDFGAVGDGVADDTKAFIAAMASGGNTIYLPPGTYLSNFGNPLYQPTYINTIPSGTHFVGAGETTIWRNYTNNSGSPSGRDSLGCMGTDSGSVSVWTEDIRFSNIKFVGWAETSPTVDEGNHLLFLSSVKRVLIDKCYFVAPRGDAIYIGSGFGGGASNERHNFDVTIRDCVFDGVNYKNRNAISVIDIDGIVIEGCTFRNFSDPLMPGSIDFEPDQSYGVIKNVFINNNNFVSCDGEKGHIVFGCDNIPTNNQQNWTITNNHINDAVSGIYLLTEKTAPSVPPTNAQNILIANNTITNVTDFINQFKGTIYGITIANNILHSTGANTGRIQFADGTADWTIRDLVFTGNSVISNINIALQLTHNLENVTVSNNVMRGSTQAHMRFGATGTSTTSIVVTDNQLLGTPSNFLCQHDASTFNQVTNVWKNNRAPVTVSNNFRGYAVDVTGINQNVFTTATLPSEFPYGESVSYLNSVNVGAATLAGITKTYKHSSLNNTNIYQVFWPTYDATYANDFYFRKAVDASTWSAWYNVAGV